MPKISQYPDGLGVVAGEYFIVARAGVNKKVKVAPGYGTTEGRLTLVTGTPVPTTDQTAKTTIYFTPYKGEIVMLYTGTGWEVYNLNADLSVSVPATASTPFDIFLDYNGGTPQLVTTNWTNDTTRATALTKQDGVYVQTGNLDWKYLGTGRTTGTNGQCEDSTSRRFLWNYYNRIDRQMIAYDTTNTWNYTTASWRAANNNTTDGTGRFSCVVGVSEDLLRVDVQAVASSSVAAGVLAASGVGIDSVVANSAQTYGATAAGGGAIAQISAVYRGYLSAGYHYIQQLEISQASGTTTWWGDGAISYLQTGMVGSLPA